MEKIYFHEKVVIWSRVRAKGIIGARFVAKSVYIYILASSTKQRLPEDRPACFAWLS
jgi:hypothetical protein